MKHIVTLKYTQGDKLCDSATKRVASRTGMPHRRSPGESSKMKLSVYSQGATVAFLPACCLPPREMDHQMPESRLCGTVDVPDSGPGDQWMEETVAVSGSTSVTHKVRNPPRPVRRVRWSPRRCRQCGRR